MHKMSHDDNRKKKMNFMLPLEYCKIGIQHKMSHDDNRKKKMNFMLPLEYCKIGIQPKLAWSCLVNRTLHFQENVEAWL